MNTIIINGCQYVSCDYLLEYAPIYCKPSRNGRELIKRKNITQFIYARNQGDIWVQSDGSSKKYDKIFLPKEFLNTIPELNRVDAAKVEDSNGIEEAPPIIILEDKEKFKNENGETIEIETRGTRNVDGIFFRVKDVAAGFKMDNLLTTIISSSSTYTITKHYKYFNCKVLHRLQNLTIKKYNKELYLTYLGLIRVLFVSRSTNADNFVKWATEKLFVLQMGSVLQKRELSSSLLGVDANVMKEVFNTYRRTMPCVYLFTLQTVKELRETMKIPTEKYPDDAIVAKYGFTKDLARRTGEHISKYNKFKNVSLKLKYHSYIDPQYISNAETDIKNFMEAFCANFSFENEDEIVIIPKDAIKIVERQYEFIGNSYMGHTSELITKIKDMEHAHQKELLTRDNELILMKHELELSREKFEHELLKRDFEILKLRSNL